MQTSSSVFNKLYNCFNFLLCSYTMEWSLGLKKEIKISVITVTLVNNEPVRSEKCVYRRLKLLDGSSDVDVHTLKIKVRIRKALSLFPTVTKPHKKCYC